MQVAIEHRPGSVVALTVTLEPAEIEARMEQLFQKHARRINIPGFRPGKAPRRMLEERIPVESLRMDAVEALIDPTFRQALQQEELMPLERGEIEDMKANDDGTVTYIAVVPVRPAVTLPDYTALTVHREATVIGDAQVDDQLEQLRTRTADYSEVPDVPIETGDYVTVDYEMTLDGEAYPDGSTTGYPLEVGTDTFFPELNETLLGHKEGESFELTVNYADDFSNPDLAGKTGTFTVTVQQVRRRVVPELSDAWVETVTNGQAHTVDEVREIIRANLKRQAAQSDRDAVRADLVRQIVDQSEMEIPDVLVAEEYERLMHRFQHQLSHDHLTMEEYAEMTNTTVEALEENQQLMARDYVRRSLVLQEIARRESIGVADEEIDAMVRVYAYSNGMVTGEMTAAEEKKLRKEMEKSGQLDHIASMLFHEKLFSFLESKADVKIEGGEPEEDTDAASETEAVEEPAVAPEPEAAPEEPTGDA